VEKERVKFVNHRSRKILVLDLSDGNVDDIAKVIDRGSAIIKQAKPKSLVTLTDVTNIVIRSMSTQHMVEFVRSNKPFVKAAAIVGLNGLTKSILSMTNLVTGRNIKPFDTREQAFDWLVSNDKPNA